MTSTFTVDILRLSGLLYFHASYDSQEVTVLEDEVLCRSLFSWRFFLLRSSLFTYTFCPELGLQTPFETPSSSALESHTEVNVNFTIQSISSYLDVLFQAPFPSQSWYLHRFLL